MEINEIRIIFLMGFICGYTLLCLFGIIVGIFSQMLHDKFLRNLDDEHLLNYYELERLEHETKEQKAIRKMQRNIKKR